MQTSQAGQSAQDKQQGLQSAIAATYAQVYAAVLAQQAAWERSHGTRLPLIATGHLTTVGASRSESVREIYVGALEAFPTNAFPPAHYIALGHIHQPQKVGGLEHIRYSGSPIALGFDELHRRKEMLLVDLNDQGLQAVTPLPVPVFQPMAAVAGTLATLPATLQAAAAPGTPERPVWLEVCIHTDDYLPDLAARMDALAQGLPVRVLRVRRQRGSSAPQLAAQAGESLHELTPYEVFERRLAQEALPPEEHAALQARYRSVLAALHMPDAEAA